MIQHGDHHLVSKPRDDRLNAGEGPLPPAGPTEIGKRCPPYEHRKRAHAIVVSDQQPLAAIEAASNAALLVVMGSRPRGVLDQGGRLSIGA